MTNHFTKRAKGLKTFILNVNNKGKVYMLKKNNTNNTRVFDLLFVGLFYCLFVTGFLALVSRFTF